MTQMLSTRHSALGIEGAMELPHNLGWTDGLPVVPPTEERVAAFLSSASLDPRTVVAKFVERGRTLTAEKMAINAVMAGCRPEYAPVLLAALDAMADERFQFNHLASLGSPWPLMVVNGPIAREIGIYSGGGLFGPGHRANLTISRATSLILSNCLGQKADQTQRAQWGNTMRFTNCIAENEETDWEPLHVQRGLAPGDSAVTIVSSYPGSPGHVRVARDKPAPMLDSVCHAIGHWGGAELAHGTYVLMMGPHMAQTFIKAGWSKNDVCDYIKENTRVSIADLKRRGAWGKWLPETSDEELAVAPGDEETSIQLFGAPGPYAKFLYMKSTLEDQDSDIFVVVAGGETGFRMLLTVPYQVSTNAVTKKVQFNPTLGGR